MHHSNSENPLVGKKFEIVVQAALQNKFGLDFEIEKKILIGNPAKAHRFDLVSCDERFVIECKCYTWTESGNVPSAKMGFINEAAFYLSFLPENVDKLIVMLKAVHPRRAETLAQYYFRTNRHLLRDIKIYEFDLQSGELCLVGQNIPVTCKQIIEAN